MFDEWLSRLKLCPCVHDSNLGTCHMDNLELGLILGNVDYGLEFTLSLASIRGSNSIICMQFSGIIVARTWTTKVIVGLESGSICKQSQAR